MSSVERLETGTVQVKGDWPGVFIRGDNALMYYAPAIDHAASFLEKSNKMEDILYSKALRGLEHILRDCRVRKDQQVTEIKVVS